MGVAERRDWGGDSGIKDTFAKTPHQRMLCLSSWEHRVVMLFFVVPLSFFFLFPSPLTDIPDKNSCFQCFPCFPSYLRYK